MTVLTSETCLQIHFPLSLPLPNTLFVRSSETAGESPRELNALPAQCYTLPVQDVTPMSFVDPTTDQCRE